VVVLVLGLLVSCGEEIEDDDEHVDDYDAGIFLIVLVVVLVLGLLAVKKSRTTTSTSTTSTGTTWGDPPVWTEPHQSLALPT
jgi:hypothetical protein